jgi:F-type H+-transporting ATPase subunit epsilon
MVRVREDEVTVLADAAELPKDIDLDRAREAEDRADGRIDRPDEWNIERALKSMMRARLRIRVATSKPGSKAV